MDYRSIKELEMTLRFGEVYLQATQINLLEVEFGKLFQGLLGSYRKL